MQGNFPLVLHHTQLKLEVSFYKEHLKTDDYDFIHYKISVLLYSATVDV